MVIILTIHLKFNCITAFNIASVNKDFLETFIGKMSAAEKKYISQYAFQYTVKNDLQQLFTSIAGGNKNNRQGNFTAVQRHKLSELLLENMALFHRNDSNRHAVLMKFLSCKVLSGKGLATESIKRLNKLIAMLLKHEDFEFCIVCIKELNNLLRNNIKAIDAITEANENLAYVTGQLSINTAYSIAMDSYYTHRSQYGTEQAWNKTIQRKVVAILNAAIKQNETYEKSYTNRCFSLLIQITIAAIKGNDEHMMSLQKQLIDFMLSDKLLVTYNQMNVLVTVNAYMNRCLTMNKFEEFEKVFSNYEKIEFSLTPRDNARWFLIKKNLILNFYFKQNNYNKALSLVGSIISEMDEHEKISPKGSFVALHLNIAITYFQTKKFSKCTLYIHKALFALEESPNNSFRILAIILLLMNQVEAGDRKFIVQNIEEYLHDTELKKLFPNLETVVTFFLNIAEAKNNKQQQQLFGDMYVALNKMEGEKGFTMLESINFNEWIKARRN